MVMGQQIAKAIAEISGSPSLEVDKITYGTTTSLLGKPESTTTAKCLLLITDTELTIRCIQNVT